jgi:hypothetical protein
MKTLRLDLAELTVNSFDAIPAHLAMESRLASPGSPSWAACTYPKYTCAFPCPSQMMEG